VIDIFHDFFQCHLGSRTTALVLDHTLCSSLLLLWIVIDKATRHPNPPCVPKSSFGTTGSPSAWRQLIISYNIGPTAVTLPTQLAFSHNLPRTLGPLTVICGCVSMQVSSHRDLDFFDLLCSYVSFRFGLDGAFPSSVAIAPRLSGPVSPPPEIWPACGVVSFWADIIRPAIDLV
jgi:hypothetical protein